MFLIFLTVFSFALLINESFDVNQKYVWEHLTPNGYENTASLNFLLNVNSDLIFDPYRNSQAGSLLGILCWTHLEIIGKDTGFINLLG